MTKNNKIVLSLAAIAMLSSTSVNAAEITDVHFKPDTANTTFTYEKQGDVTDTNLKVTSKLGTSTADPDMSNIDKLIIDQADSSLNIGDTKTGGANIGGDDTKSYNFDLKAKDITLEGKTSNPSSLYVGDGKAGTITADSTTLNRNSSIDVEGKLTVNGALDTTNGKISFKDKGQLNANGEVKAKGDSFDFTNAGTLTLGDNTNITGTGSSRLDLKKGTIDLTQGKTANIEGLYGQKTDGGKLNLNGANLTVGEIDIDASNLGFDKGGVLNFNDEGVITGELAVKDSTLNFEKNSQIRVDTINAEQEGQYVLKGGELIVEAAKGNASSFDLNEGGMLYFQTNKVGNQTPAHDVALTDIFDVANADVEVSGSGSISFEGIKAEGTGSFTINGEHGTTVNVTNKGLHAKGENIQFNTTSGGTLNLQAGSSNITGDLALKGGAEEVKSAHLNVGNGTDKADLAFNGTTTIGGTTDKQNHGTLTINKEGAVAANDTLTLNKTGKIDLKGGTLDINANAEGQGGLTVAEGALDITKGGTLNFNGGTSNVGDAAAWDLSSIDGTVNFNGGSIVKVGADAKGTLTLNDKSSFNKGAELQLAKLDAKKGSVDTGSVKIQGVLQNGDTPDAFKFNKDGFSALDEKTTLALKATEDTTMNFYNGKTTVSGDINTEKMTLELDNGAILDVSGNFTTAVDQKITFVQRQENAFDSVINVGGNAEVVSGTSFNIASTVTSKLLEYTLINVTGETGSVSDKGAKITLQARKNTQELINKYGLDLDDTQKETLGDEVTGDLKNKDVKLEVVGKKLVAKVDENTILDTTKLANLKSSSMEADIAALETINTTLSDKDADFVDSAAGKDLSAKIDDAVKKQSQAKDGTLSDAQIAQDIVKEAGGDVKVDSDILLSAYGSGTSAVVKSLIGEDFILNKAQGVVKDIKEVGASSTNLASSTASVMNNINLSNNVAISGRVAAAHNPYGNLASGFADYYYAAISGDLPLYYADNEYKNGFWANAVGGLNQIDGESGSLYGLSLGYDRQFDGFLAGLYLSYASAELNDKIVKQDSSNIQVGLYGSLNQREVEVNFKAYGQASMTDLTTSKANAEYNGDFVRLYGGASADVGILCFK